ncbi:uncharacterized protein LOC111674344, partial [Orussus abietinus]|uniref:uncharacterized protein LOC111674344 n=1 Tax=Orussus abietinus TaxID=222816 RepID=UPI000C7162B3
QEPDGPAEHRFLEQCQFLDQHHQRQPYTVYNLQNEFALLGLEPFRCISSNDCRRNNIYLFSYSQGNENDNNYNECRVPPPFPFRYETPNRSLSITDVTYDGSNPGENNNAIVRYDENDYDDVEEDDEEESPRKGILKQMFCLPLH